MRRQCMVMLMASCKSNITSHRVFIYLNVSVVHVNRTFVRFTHDAYNGFRT
jgi:hypothetical protein